MGGTPPNSRTGVFSQGSAVKCLEHGTSGLPKGRPTFSVDFVFLLDHKGSIILMVSGGCQSQTWGLFAFNPPLRG